MGAPLTPTSHPPAYARVRDEATAEIRRRLTPLVRRADAERAERAAVHLDRKKAGAGPMSTTNPDSIDVHVGARLRLRRNLVRMTQETLAAAVGISYQQVQKYETGKNQISVGRLVQLAAVLKVEPVWFLEGAPTLAAIDGGLKADGLAAEVLANLGTVEGHRLNREFARLSDPKARQRVVSIVAAAVEIALGVEAPRQALVA